MSFVEVPSDEIPQVLAAMKDRNCVSCRKPILPDDGGHYCHQCDPREPEQLANPWDLVIGIAADMPDDEPKSGINLRWEKNRLYVGKWLVGVVPSSSLLYHCFLPSESESHVVTIYMREHDDPKALLEQQVREWFREALC